MSRKHCALFGGFLITFFAICAWLVYTAIQTNNNSFLTGVPPEDVLRALIPKTIDLSLMRPPAVRNTDPMRYGGATSTASVIIFGDFECESCKALSKTLDTVLPAYKGNVRLIWHDLPVTDVNPRALDAAIFARCAQTQNKFWEAHDALYKAPSLSESTFRDIVKALKVDATQMQQCRQEKSIRQFIEQDVKTARADGVNAAPFLFIGTKAFSGPLSAEKIKSELDLFLKS